MEASTTPCPLQCRKDVKFLFSSGSQSEIIDFSSVCTCLACSGTTL